MKIRITFETDEELEKALHTPPMEFIKQGAKLKWEAKTAFKHAYITIGKSKKGQQT